MRLITKRHNCTGISIAAITATLFLPTLAFAEAGAKSMFADDSSSVMMSDNVPSTLDPLYLKMAPQKSQSI